MEGSGTHGIGIPQETDTRLVSSVSSGQQVAAEAQPIVSQDGGATWIFPSPLYLKSSIPYQHFDQ